MSPLPLEELGYLGQIESFALDIAQGRTPELGAAFGRSVLDLTCAAYSSAAADDGAWVDLPFTGPRNLAPIHLWRR